MRELNPATTALYGAMAGVMDESQQGLLCRADPQCRRAFYVRADKLCTEAAAARNTHEVDDHGYTHVIFELSAFKFGSALPRKRKHE